MFCVTKRSRRVFCIAVVILLTAAFAFLCVPCTAEAFSASLPSGYYDAAGAQGDWYFGEDYLDIEGAAELVAQLRAEYDFSAQESDPVVIAVIDTGLNAENELFGQTENGTDVFFRDSEGNVVCYNALTGASGSLSDVSDGATGDYHGTHVAGILALLIRALGLDDVIKIMPIKAGTRSGSGNSFSERNVERAIDFALENGADVVNMSLGISESKNGSDAWKDIVTSDDSEKAVFVAAAGNYSDSSESDAFYPAASENVIGVMNYSHGAVGAEMYASSNYGSLYDVCAPGTSVISADGATGGYKQLTGTSMASPIAAFAVALLRVRCEAQGTEATAEQLKEMFLLTFRDTADYRGEDYPLLSLAGVLEADFAFDGEGNCYLVSAASDGIVFPTQSVTLGRGREVTFSSSSEYTDTGAMYVWSYSADGVNMSAEGQEVTVVMDVSEKEDIAVTLRIYAPDGTLLATRVGYLATEYLVPTAANSLLTMSLRADEDGTVQLASGRTLVLGVDTLRYADPQTEAVWYVNGARASSEPTFAFYAEEGGYYEIYVTVNGEKIGETVRVSAEGEPAGTGLSDGEIAGITVGAAAAAGGCVAAGFALRRRARARRDSRDVESAA